MVGMHPDQATEAIVDFAAKYDKPFAVVGSGFVSRSPLGCDSEPGMFERNMPTVRTKCALYSF